MLCLWVLLRGRGEGPGQGSTGHGRSVPALTVLRPLTPWIAAWSSLFQVFASVCSWDNMSRSSRCLSWIYYPQALILSNKITFHISIFLLSELTWQKNSPSPHTPTRLWVWWDVSWSLTIFAKLRQNNFMLNINYKMLLFFYQKNFFNSNMASIYELFGLEHWMTDWIQMLSITLHLVSCDCISRVGLFLSGGTHYNMVGF